MDEIKTPRPSRAHVPTSQRRSYVFASAPRPHAHAASPAPATETHDGGKPQGRKGRWLLSVLRGARNRVYLTAAYVWRQCAVFTKRLPLVKRYPLWGRLGWGFMALVMFGTVLSQVIDFRRESGTYQVSGAAETLLSEPRQLYADKLVYNKTNKAYEYNSTYQGFGAEVAGQSGAPKFTASFSEDASQGITIKDPVAKSSVTFKPLYKTAAARKDQNRMVYPLKGRDATKVYTLRGVLLKEDIILNKFQGDRLDFAYDLELPEGTEARMESNGSVGIYGVSTTLLGDVATGSDKDAELLQKARQNGEKTNLLFTLPAPFVKEFGSNTKSKNAAASFDLEGSRLTLKASGLKDAQYPLSIDPTIYIETAAKLMRGNNETNTDFDIDNELIQKSQTTGARIDAWTDATDMNSAVWNQSTTAAGGYVYRAGGTTGITQAEIVSSTTTVDTSDGTSFTMDMPATRPAGDLYVAVMCHDGSSGSNMTGPAGGGWTEYADLQGHAAYYKIGTDQGGGNEAATYQWTGPSETYAGVIIRITGFDSSDVVSGTAGTGSNGSAVVPVFPTTTPDTDATLVVRAVGADADTPSSTAWVPTGHTKIASGSSSGGAGNPCGFVAAALDVPPNSGVATGTATLADSSITDDYGASSLAITATPATPAAQSTVQWAKFNTSTSDVESPNPGTGTCSGWCTNSAYDMPGARSGGAMVSYNGFLYYTGGTTSTTGAAANGQTNVWVAKLGANGEPALWHPTGGTAAYWFQSANTLPVALTDHQIYAYNNKLYLVGGRDTSANSVTTVRVADILPTGDITAWSTTGMQALPDARHGHSVHVYNDVMYLIGGVTSTAGGTSHTFRNTVYYSKLNSDGTMNTWTATNNFTTARASMGGMMSGVLGAYIYLAGGCTAFTSNLCSTVASDVQIASINADGTLSEWGSISNLSNQRMSYSFIAWQGGLYRFGGCSAQNTGTGACRNVYDDVEYGVVKPAGEVSTVSISVPSGTSPCSGGSPQNCDLPPAGDDAGEGGQMLSMTAVMNGFFYVLGGCIAFTCNGNDAGSGDDADVTGNVVYAAMSSTGQLVAPSACSGTSYGAWCVITANRINGTNGVAAAGVATFNGRIYTIGGFDGSNLVTNIYYNDFNTDGSPNGAWETSDVTTAGVANDVAYTYAFARANPASAGSNPGNLFIFGGCGTYTGGAGCAGNDYETFVYKCNIGTTGAVSGCSTTNQLQIDSTPGTGGTDGLGTHSGTVYANYVYLIGGLSQAETDKDDVLYAKIDNSNNIVDADGETVTDDAWIESPNKLSVGRRRGFSFGYNGHIYSVGGYDGSSVVPFIEWSKMDVSDGSIGAFTTSSIQITQRWGLSMVVSNAYAYVIGGCDNGASPGSCTSFERSIQIFQIYNNESGGVNNYTAQGDDTFATNTDRIGASAAIYNGYMYVAGGCTAINCSTVTDNTQRIQLSSVDGSPTGNWADTTDATLPAQRAFGQLEVAGATLYYTGGIDATGDEKSEVYYGPIASNNVAAWTATTTSLPQDRAYHGGTVWNNRLYVVGGIDDSATATSTVYVSPQMNSGGDITGAWSSSTAFNVARTGAAVTAYANNLYLLGGFDGTNYLNDTQFTQINSDGTVDSWTYSTSLPGPIRDAEAFAANGYIYLIGGRSAATTCAPNAIVTPVSANTTIATGNNPTGIGEWYETNVKYTGDRYGAAAVYDDGKFYLMGGGCSALVTANRHYYSTVKSQPQVAMYSRMIDTDTDVFPNSWLMNGLDNSIGARWQVKYRSMHDISDGAGQQNPNEDCGTSSTMPLMTTWGQETNYGDVTLGDVATYTPLNGSGSNINCARYYYFSVSIDASKTFGYPEDVNRGPTIYDLSLFFTADPSKRLRHGKTFTGGELQPLDTPCRQSNDAQCPLP